MTRRSDLPEDLRKYHPIPDNGCWWEQPGWEEVTRRVGRVEVAHRAMTGLRTTFTPDVVVNMGTTHPFVRRNVEFGGALGLLEIGLALAELDVRGSVKKRLLDGDQFDGTEFELWAGLLFRRLGASVEHEPLGERVKGPDWRVRWNSGALSVEAKRPDWSADARALQHAATEFAMAFSRGLVQPTSERLYLSVDIRPDLYEDSVDPTTRQVDVEKARQEGARLATQLGQVAIDQPDVLHEVAGHFARATRQVGDAGVQPSISGPPTDPEREVIRTCRILRDAVDQGCEAKLPVVVVLDAANEFGMGMRYAAASRLLAERTESWTEHVAAVIVRSGGWWPDRPRPHTFVGVVPGPLADHLPREVFEGLRGMVCDHGHAHFEPLAEGDPRPCAFRPGWGL